MIRYLWCVRYQPDARWHFRDLSEDLVSALTDASAEAALQRSLGVSQAETFVWAVPYPGEFAWSFRTAPVGWRPMIVDEESLEPDLS